MTIPLRHIFGFILTSIFLLLLSSCNIEDGQNGKNNPNRDITTNSPLEKVEVIQKGYNSALVVRDDYYQVINTRPDFEDFWTQHTGSNTGIVPSNDYTLPDIDFDSKTVIALVMSEQSTGGFAIGLKSYELVEGGASATVARVSPGDDCMLIQAITRPFYIAAVDKVETVTFHVENITEECGPPKPRPNFEIIDSGNTSNILSQESIVVQDQAHFDRLWGRYNPTDGPQPSIDFNTTTVVAQFLGSAVACGRSITHIEVDDATNVLEVYYIIEVPEVDIQCLVAEQPYVVIALEKTQKLVSANFNVKRVTLKQ